jgi:hypothetical protein
MTALITGGTGFIGRQLARRLSNPIIAGRSKEKIRAVFGGDTEAREWDQEKGIEPSFLKGVDTVFHLAGESVFDGRWDDAKKRQIRNSRVESTRKLVEAIGKAEQKPKTLICGSAVGIYGPRGEEKLSEQSAPGNDFLARVCIDWEKEALKAEEYGVRVVNIRTGVVLGNEGGAFAKMLLPFKLGLGGRLGSGKQFMPWIHIDDHVGIMLHAMENMEVRGPVNAVAPEPVRNIDFTKTLAAALHRPAFLPVPEFALKIVLGEFATVLLGSQRVTPSVAQQSNYTFTFQEIGEALRDLISKRALSE